MFDHLSLWLQLNRQVYVPRGRRFRFENIWINDKDCRGIIQAAWHQSGYCKLLNKVAFDVLDWRNGVGLCCEIYISSWLRIRKKCEGFVPDVMQLVFKVIMRLVGGT